MAVEERVPEPRVCALTIKEMTERLKHSKLFLWCVQVLRVCGRELLLVFRDEGVIIFFLLLNAV